ncbi:MAG: uroporphyrinogen-III synthase [Pseudomonadota bacterium]
MTVLLTRPVADSDRIAATLASHGIETLIWPLTRIEIIATDIHLTDDTEAIVFSSANGVRGFAATCARRDLAALCVGRRTAELAGEHGFSDVRDADGAFQDLVDLVVRTARRRVAYARGETVSGNLSACLIPHDIDCDEHIVYRTLQAEEPPDDVACAFMEQRMDVVTIWSTRNAHVLADSLTAREDWRLDRTVLVAISESAAEPLAKAGFGRIAVASRPNATEMIAEICVAVR